MFLIMGPVHFLFLFVDVFVYQYELMAIVGDVLFSYASFYNFMTLKKPTCGAQAVMYVLTLVIAFSHI